MSSSPTSRDLGIGEHHDVLESYRMFAADRGWVRRIADAIRSGLTAEARGAESPRRYSHAA